MLPKYAYLPRDPCMRVRYLLALALAFPVVTLMGRMLVVMIMAVLRGPVSSCPKCLSKRTRRSMPRRSDKIFAALMAPRRCESCRYRFYSRPSAGYNRRAKTSRPLIPATPQGGSRH
jgi:hypothetical protein